MRHFYNKPANLKLDFEIGYLIKSPCRECQERHKFPECIDECLILDQIHEILLDCVSCSRG